VPKIIINNTVNLSFKTAVSILLISNHDCFRVLFDLIKLLPYILLEKYSNIGNDQPREPALCQLYRHTFVPNENGELRKDEEMGSPGSVWRY